ncbi:hypothetical protein [Methanofollis formosanus]|nr:hypothetical protein [Methanofollis formosanus]
MTIRTCRPLVIDLFCRLARGWAEDGTPVIPFPSWFYLRGRADRTVW